METEMLVAVFGALGVAKLVGDILGPTAKYLGEGLRDWAKQRIENTAKIFKAAERKLGPKIHEPGAVPPRVLKGILTEGSFSDDFLAQEYFGGVLASSRSGASRDDRGAYFIALVSRLSSYQLRTHYIFYHIIKDLFDGEILLMTRQQDRDTTTTYIPLDMYMEAMDFDEQEYEKRSVLIGHIMFGLAKENLIEGIFSYDTPEGGKWSIVFTPSALGTELFLWVYGKPNIPMCDFLKTDNKFEVVGGIHIPEGARKVSIDKDRQKGAGGLQVSSV